MKARPDGIGTVAVWLAVLALAVFLPGAFNRWFLPKELLMVAAILLASLAAARGRLPRMIWLGIGVGVAILLGAALVSTDPVAAIMGRWPRYEGLVALPVYLGAAWLGARLLGPDASASRLTTFHRALAVVSLLIGGVSLLESVGLRPLDTDLSRPGALLGNATDQGLVGAALAVLLMPPLMSAVAALRAAPRGRRSLAHPVLVGAAVLAGILTVAVSASRAGLLALLVGIVVVVILHALRRAAASGARAGLSTLGWGALLAAAALAVVLLLPDMRARLLGLTGLAAQTVDDRMLIWQTSLGMVADKPLLGWGPSGYLDAVAVRHGSDWFATVDAGTTLDSPHNWLLQAASAGGIPLLVTAVALAGVIAVLGIRRLRAMPDHVDSAQRDALRSDMLQGALAALSALGVGLLTHFTAASTGMLIGLLIGVVTAAAPAAEPRRWRTARSVALAVWLGWFALTTFAELPLAAGTLARSAPEADRQFHVAAALRPWDADLVSIAAQTLTARADSGDPIAVPLALDWAERAAEAAPHSLTARYTHAVALRAAGDADAAADLLTELQQRQPHDPRFAMQLGITLILQGKHAAGLEWIEKAHAATPDDETIARMLDWARQAGP